MKLEGDEAMAVWLEQLDLAAERFDWDKGNRPKLAKHGVTPVDVMEMFEAALVFAGRVIEPAHSESRWLVLGKNKTGRALALLFTGRGDRVRPISCRSMRREERSIYKEAVNDSPASKES